MQSNPEIVVGPPGVGVSTEVQSSPVVEDVLAISANFEISGVNASGIQDSCKLSAIVTLDRTINRKCTVVRVAETPPGPTASPTEVWVAVRMDTSPISPSDDPSITEDIVVSVEREG